LISLLFFFFSCLNWFFYDFAHLFIFIFKSLFVLLLIIDQYIIVFFRLFSEVAHHVLK
jgi:hypothetical protein